MLSAAAQLLHLAQGQGKAAVEVREAVSEFTGILYSLLEAREIEADWLMALHIGKFGPLDLEPFYSVILGICVLVLAGSGLSLWFKTRRRAS
jgi:uncharacterized iron-regulated membrane protein